MTPLSANRTPSSDSNEPFIHITLHDQQHWYPDSIRPYHARPNTLGQFGDNMVAIIGTTEVTARSGQLRNQYFD